MLASKMLRCLDLGGCAGQELTERASPRGGTASVPGHEHPRGCLRPLRDPLHHKQRHSPIIPWAKKGLESRVGCKQASSTVRIVQGGGMAAPRGGGGQRVISP